MQHLRALHLLHIDCKTAFLNGESDVELYVEQPEGFVLPTTPSTKLEARPERRANLRANQQMKGGSWATATGANQGSNFTSRRLQRRHHCRYPISNAINRRPLRPLHRPASPPSLNSSSTSPRTALPPCPKPSTSPSVLQPGPQSTYDPPTTPPTPPYPRSLVNADRQRRQTP